ncbi:MAG TPA: hypothetical protein VGL42_06420 [Opitutaceae bacterium]|jgi:hypothetical protein
MPIPCVRSAGYWLVALFVCGSTSLTAFNRVGTVFATDGSQADVAAAIAAAGAGNLVELPAGTFTWGAAGTITYINKAIVLSGAGTGGDGTTIQLAPDGPSETTGTIELFAACTVENLSIVGATGASVCAFSANSTASNWQITNVTYVQSDSNFTAYFCASNSSYGLIDNCTITSLIGNNELIFGRGPGNSWQAPDSSGTANAVFIEDCTFNGPGYVCDANANARFVVRFCTINGAMKVDGHGLASNSPARGVRQMEVYDNTWTTSTADSPAIEIRGGTGYIFGNQTINQTAASSWLYLDEYGALGTWPNFGSAYQTPASYPVADQIGIGEDPKAAHSDPIYVWGNLAAASAGAGAATVDWALAWKPIPAAAVTANGGVTFTMGPSSPCIIHQNQDYFKQNVGETFDGSGSDGNGVGSGTLAQMNALTPAVTGVGFWVTDQGNWNQRAGGMSGTLYVWNGSSWTQHYTPYTYPHPLRSPNGPGNLRIVAQ